MAHALKEKYSGSRIDWIAKQSAVDIIKNNPHINKVFVIEGLKCPEEEYDLLINFDDEESACKLASEIKKKKLVGAYFEDGKRKYTDDSSEWFDMGLISRYGKEKADKLKAANTRTYHEMHFSILGLKHDKKHQTKLFLDKENHALADAFAKKHNIAKEDLVIGLNTGAGGRWQDKKLSVEKTAELIKKLRENFPNAKLLLFGGPEEKERNKNILENVNIKIIDAGCGNSLMEFASLVNLCSTLVTSDSLALHIGVALKKKVVVFFAPTSPQEIELYSRGIKIIPKKGCVCCYKPKCDIPPEWDIDEFVNAVKKLI